MMNSSGLFIEGEGFWNERRGLGEALVVLITSPAAGAANDLCGFNDAADDDDDDGDEDDDDDDDSDEDDCDSDDNDSEDGYYDSDDDDSDDDDDDRCEVCGNRHYCAHD